MHGNMNVKIQSCSFSLLSLKGSDGILTLRLSVAHVLQLVPLVTGSCYSVSKVSVSGNPLMKNTSP